jgi:hypothetical protein
MADQRLSKIKAGAMPARSSLGAPVSSRRSSTPCSCARSTTRTAPTSARAPTPPRPATTVSGGGKKPWKQKGTRPRAPGLHSAPTSGAAVPSIFGPLPRDYREKTNTQEAPGRLPVAVLSSKLAAGEMIIVQIASSFPPTSKTKSKSSRLRRQARRQGQDADRDTREVNEGLDSRRRQPGQDPMPRPRASTWRTPCRSSTSLPQRYPRPHEGRAYGDP